MHEERFDYETGVWGAEDIAPDARTLAAFRLERALAHVPHEGRVVEVGCGAGRYLRAISRERPELRLCGMDVSRRALALAATSAADVDWRHVEEEGGALPATDGEFDAVLALDVLEHVEQPLELLREMARILRPGGTFHLCVPCEGDPRSLWRWLPGQSGPGGLKRRFAGHLWRFRRGEILDAVAGAGLEQIALDHSLHVVGNLADVGVFVGMALERRLRGPKTARTTGDVLSQSGSGAGGAAVAFVDRLLWWEARWLSRVPSWCLHLSAQRTG